MTSVVAAAIINWNSGPMLRRAVESVLENGEVENVVVVDNASSDGSLGGVGAIGDRVNVIENVANLGFAGAINQAFKATTSPFVLILNPDIQAVPGAIAALAGALDAHPKAGAVGGFANQSYPPRPFPTLASLFRENLGLGRPEIKVSGEEAKPVDQPAGAAMMVRRTAFDAVGGFDEQFYPAWYEDVDFCRAISAAGWEIYFHPGAKFHHDGGYSLEALGLERFLTSYYDNQFRYARKHLGPRSGWSLKTALAFGMLVKMMYRPRLAGTYWRVLWEVL